MAKKNKKTNRELLQEIREEGMFKEASDFTNKKKKYVAASEKDQAMMYVLLLIALFNKFLIKNASSIINILKFFMISSLQHKYFFTL